ncbi:MAG: dual specificity protein phosphatase family protein [Gammaproteobacteria bacterium]|nr:dual specificity protein phosphatase family protein [Gammaproteobacteria bacterium]
MNLKIVGLVCLLSMFVSTAALADSVKVRPTNWAQALLSEDLDNCFKVTDSLYRCGQPDKKAFKILKQQGIGEVLNLREYHSDKGKTDEMVLHRLKWDTGEVSEPDLVQALQIIQEAKEPLVVHCWHGADRTGTVIAAYRIIFQDWTKEAALEEMTMGGFGYHSFYDNLISLIEDMDVAQMKKELGLE